MEKRQIMGNILDLIEKRNDSIYFSNGGTVTKEAYKKVLIHLIDNDYVSKVQLARMISDILNIPFTTNSTSSGSTVTKEFLVRLRDTLQ